jgi:hypothetical protein
VRGRDRDVHRLALDTAGMMMDRYAVRCIDAAAYGKAIIEAHYDRFEIEGGGIWFVLHDRPTDAPAGRVLALLPELEVPDDHWPANLAAARAAQAPEQIRGLPHRVCAVRAKNIHRYALAAAFEWIDEDLERCFDLDKWIERLSTRVETATDIWHVIVENDDIFRRLPIEDVRAQLARNGRPVQGAMVWSDELIAALGEQCPEALLARHLPRVLVGEPEAVRAELGKRTDGSIREIVLPGLEHRLVVLPAS